MIQRLPLVKGGSQTKVRNPNFNIKILGLGYQNVFKFQISMYYTLLVEKIYSQKKLLHYNSCLFLRIKFLFSYSLHERSPTLVLQN